MKVSPTRCKQACRGCGVTSEVLLMNLEAVVLGADSAVTITGAERGRFSQAGIEKIYLINESGPVAAMVYGAGAYVGLPWKTVLGQFRDYCGPDLLTIEDYSERLIAYLADIGEHTNVGLNENYEILNFHRYIDDFIQDYALWLFKFGWRPGAALPEDLAELALRHYENEVLMDPNLEDEDDTAGPLPRASVEPTDRLVDFVTAHLGDAIKSAMGRKFDGAPFPESCIEPLIKLSVASILVDWLPDSSIATGLVLTGFGAHQPLPGVFSFRFVGAFGGLLKSHRSLARRPKPTVTPVIFHSYAQDDLIRGFVYGAIPQFEYHVRQATIDYLTRTFATVIEAVSDANPKLGEQVAALLEDVPVIAPFLGLSAARDQRTHHVFETLWPTLATANAEVLGSHALKLMELTVLEHELLSEPSVARPIWILAMERGRHTWNKDGNRLP